MSELVWTPRREPDGNCYSTHSGPYTVCCVGGANGWRFEVWEERTQLVTGLLGWKQAKAWCQDYHDRKQETPHVDAEQTSLLAGQ